MKRFQKGDVVTYRNKSGTKVDRKIQRFEFVSRVEGDTLYLYNGKNRAPLKVPIEALQDTRKVSIPTLTRQASNLSAEVQNLKARLRNTKEKIGREIDDIIKYS